MARKKAPTIQRTGGVWDPAERNCYFLAGTSDTMEAVLQSAKYVLWAANEIRSERPEQMIQAMLASGQRVLLDSGIYSLTWAHALSQGLTFAQALTTPLEELEGYGALWTHYTALLAEFGEAVWGYIELDLGGQAQKCATRAKLEALGYRPIPVYHPLSDDKAYFDQLAQAYDRVAIGGIVAESQYIRARLIATLADRRRKYPHLWIHLLGVTPNEWLCGLDFDSTDSSAWSGAMRWNAGYTESAMLKQVSAFSREFRYKIGDADSRLKGTKMAALGNTGLSLSWAHWWARLREEALHP